MSWLYKTLFIFVVIFIFISLSFVPVLYHIMFGLYKKTNSRLEIFINIFQYCSFKYSARQFTSNP